MLVCTKTQSQIHNWQDNKYVVARDTKVEEQSSGTSDIIAYIITNNKILKLTQFRALALSISPLPTSHGT